MHENMTVLIKDYIDNAVIQGETTLNGDYKRGNKAVKTLKNIFKLMEQDNILALQMLDILFMNDNINVKIWAAGHALVLKVKIDEAIAILEDISVNNKSSILGFNAEMTLNNYKKQGYLKFS